MPDGAVYVGRPTVWGNPFETAEEYRKLAEAIVGISGQSHFHEVTLQQFANVNSAMGRLFQLRGKQLARWCSLDKPCHADFLAELANKEPTE